MLDLVLAMAMAAEPVESGGGAAARNTAPETVAVWRAGGWTLPPVKPVVSITPRSKASVVLDALLSSGGVRCADVGTDRNREGAGAASTVSWRIVPGALVAVAGDAGPVSGLGGDWTAAATGERASVTLEVDLNALRAGGEVGESLFDADWLQRGLDRLGASNARSFALRGAVVSPGIDGLPPEAELRALVSSRAVPAETPARSVWLVRSGWQGTDAEQAAVKGAAWVASVRSDSQGLGVLGRAGGAGTWAGLIRLGVDVIGGAEAEDGGEWDRVYAGWQSAASSGLRSLNVRVQARGTLACFAGARGSGLVLVVPGRSGETTAGLNGAINEIAGDSRGWLTKEQGLWKTRRGVVAPAISCTVASAGEGSFVVVSVEPDGDDVLLKQTVSRLR